MEEPDREREREVSMKTEQKEGSWEWNPVAWRAPAPSPSISVGGTGSVGGNAGKAGRRLLLTTEYGLYEVHLYAAFLEPLGTNTQNRGIFVTHWTISTGKSSMRLLGIR